MKKKKKLSKKKSLTFLGRFFIKKEKEFFIENLAMLIESGMNISSALKAITEEIQSKSLKEIIINVQKDISDGSPISKAFEGTNLFPRHSLSLIRIGEKSGRLSKNLQVIIAQQQKNRTFKSKLRSAMMYPIIVFFLTIIIGVGIAWFTLPRMSSIFRSLRLDLPLITRVLIVIGSFLEQYGRIVIPCTLLAVATIFFFFFFYKKTKFIGQTILFNFPGIKKLIQEIELARFGYLLGTLMDAALPVAQSLESISQATNSLFYKKFYQSLTKSVEEGNSFQKSFENIPNSKKLIPRPIQQIIITAEQSGNLSKALFKIGDIFEEKTENTTKNLAIILEPILLVTVWIGVVFVALAVILPIYSLIGGLGQGQNSSSSSKPNTKKEILLSDSSETATSTPNSTATTTQEIITLFNKLQKETATTTSKNEGLPKLEILPTGIGYLNVRKTPSLGGILLTTIKPGEIYSYDDHQNSWYKIILPYNKEGWVHGKYIKQLP